MSERRWTDADLRAAWEDGVRRGSAHLGPRSNFYFTETLDREWEQSKPRARIRALEIAQAGLPPDTQKITQAELIGLFGPMLPIEVAMMIQNAPASMSPGELRRKIRAFAQGQG